MVYQKVNQQDDQIRRIKDKYNKKFKEISGEKPQFVQYKNVHNEKKKVKQFIIDAWELEDNFISNKKQLNEEEEKNILGKDQLMGQIDQKEAELNRKKQFSFQNIKKQKIAHGKLDKNGKTEEDKNLGGLLDSLGRLNLFFKSIDTKEILAKKITSKGKFKKFGRFSVQEKYNYFSPPIDPSCLKQSLSEELSNISSQKNFLIPQNNQIKKLLVANNGKKEKTFEIKLEGNTETITNRKKNFTFSAKKKEIINSLGTNEKKKNQADNHKKVEKVEKKVLNQNLYSLQTSETKKDLFLLNSNNQTIKKQLFLKKKTVNKASDVNLYQEQNQEKIRKSKRFENQKDSNTDDVASEIFFQTTSIPLTLNKFPQIKSKMSATNSKADFGAKPNPARTVTYKYSEKEQLNSHSKLKKIISSEADLYNTKNVVKKTPKYSNQFLSKQVTIRDSDFQKHERKEMTKTKSYTKFVDFFAESQSFKQKGKQEPSKRQTSIAKKKQHHSISKTEKSLATNELPVFSNTESILSGYYSPIV